MFHCSRPGSSELRVRYPKTTQDYTFLVEQWNSGTVESGTALSTTLQFSLVIRVEQLELGGELDQLQFDRGNRVCLAY